MRIWTIQPEAVYEALREQKVLYTDISKSPLYHMEDVGVMDNPFQKGYDWFARRMEEKTGKPEGRPTPGGPGTGGTGSTKSPTCGKPGTPQNDGRDRIACGILAGTGARYPAKGSPQKAPNKKHSTKKDWLMAVGLFFAQAAFASLRQEVYTALIGARERGCFCITPLGGREGRLLLHYAARRGRERPIGARYPRQAYPPPLYLHGFHGEPGGDFCANGFGGHQACNPPCRRMNGKTGYFLSGRPGGGLHHSGRDGHRGGTGQRHRRIPPPRLP